MEFDAVDVRQVPGVDPQRIRAGERPEACGAVLGPAGEVKAAGAEVHVPHGVGVSAVQRRVGEAAQVPVAHRGVLGAGEQAGAVRQEGRAKHRAAVTSQRLDLAAGAVLLLLLGRNNETCGVTVYLPFEIL